MVHKFQLTWYEILDILDLKYVPTTATGYTLPPGKNEISDVNLMLKSLLSNEVKVNIAIDDYRSKSNLTTDKTVWFTKKSFF